MDSAGNVLTYYVHPVKEFYYVHGPGVDEPLAMIRGGQTYYYHADALGTITHLTKSSGAIAQRYDYDSFGTITSQSGPLAQPYTYTGREWDAETGLYYYRARYYDPQVGRFITPDPVGQAADITLYTYVRNAPTYWIDPSGLWAVCATVGHRGLGFRICAGENPCTKRGFVDAIIGVAVGYSISYTPTAKCPCSCDYDGTGFFGFGGAGSVGFWRIGYGGSFAGGFSLPSGQYCAQTSSGPTLKTGGWNFGAGGAMGVRAVIPTNPSDEKCCKQPSEK